MTRMLRKKKKEKKKSEPINEREINILAMQDAMESGQYDGPETAEELCYILGLI